tara:strand:- start:702 stop:1460 length:759 start_codon:yes stop_codon:yes gene_type:complete
MSIREQDKEFSNKEEQDARIRLSNLLTDCSIPHPEILSNLGLFLNSKNLSRILFMNFIYENIVDTQGVIFDLGTRWGQNMALFNSFRGIYEPYNRHRKIIGFDTFEGFPEVSPEDGNSDLMSPGNVTVSNKYENYLDQIMKCHEQDNPLSHIKKYFIVKGDANKTVPNYLDSNPETIIALAYFDFDLYKPTANVLESIIPRLTKGSILGFDELNDPDSPGETLAVIEKIGLNNIKLKRYRYSSRVSYFVYGE